MYILIHTIRLFHHHLIPEHTASYCCLHCHTQLHLKRIWFVLTLSVYYLYIVTLLSTYTVHCLSTAYYYILSVYNLYIVLRLERLMTKCGHMWHIWPSKLILIDTFNAGMRRVVLNWPGQQVIKSGSQSLVTINEVFTKSCDCKHLAVTLYLNIWSWEVWSQMSV